MRLLSPHERGASAVEYALLVAAVAAMLVVAIFAFQQTVADSFKKSCDQLAGGTNQGSC
jgi:Flp pilus assembly pilin Flp